MVLNSVRFIRRLPGGSVYILGTATQLNEVSGWRFIANVAGRDGSRKAHPTLEKCIPRWANYPDGCESTYIIQDGAVVETF